MLTGIRITRQICWNSDCWASPPQFPIKLSGRGSRIGIRKNFFFWKYNSDLLITCVWIKHKHMQTTLLCFYCHTALFLLYSQHQIHIFLRWDTSVRGLIYYNSAKRVGISEFPEGSHFEILALNHIKTDCDWIKSEFFLWPVLCVPLWFHPLPLPLFHSTPASQPPVGISTIPSLLNLQAPCIHVSFSSNALSPDVCVDYSFYTFRCLFK